MLIELLLESDIPIYTQLRNSIIQGIATGALSPSEALPSVRQLAKDIGVNMHTINKAYDQLKNEGFLTVHRRSGVVVNDTSKYRYTDDTILKLKEALQPLVLEARARQMSLGQLNAIVSELYNIPTQKGDKQNDN